MTSKTPRAHETAEHESEPASPIASENLAVDASVKSENPVFPIVGIGASAGGLEAYTQLLRALPADSGMAFVLVQHLAPEHESMLAEILARATAMPVTEVHDEPRVQPNCVYVIPPNRTMLLTEGHLKLVPRAEIRGQHRSIDSFLRSLARDQHHHAIGVILSGTGSDGTLGLEAIKAEGGITFAQDETAQHTGMPRSAVAAGCADYVLPAEAIASELIRIGRHPYVAPADATTDATSIETLQSTNEELQSVNEELRISNEEIQSSNEELSTVNDELRRRNEQLDRASNDLNNLLASSHLAMVAVGTDLRIRRFSPAAEKLLNLITADLGRPIEDRKLPLLSPDLAGQLAEVIDTASPKEQEVQDRKGRWYSLRIRPYKTLDNKIDGAVLVLVEIEEQKRVQEELRASEEKYRLLVEGASGVAIMLLDDSGRVTGWNLGAERIFGYAEAEIMGEHFSRFFIPEDVAAGKPEQELDRARHGAEISDDHWLKRKDGNRFWASAVATAMKDGAGRLRGFSKVVRDITERKQSYELLQESERRHRHVVNALPAAVYTCDAKGRVTLYNAAAVALWGREPELGKDQWCGSGKLYRLDGTELPLDRCPMAATLREGRPVRGEEVVIERPDGSRIHVLPYPEPLFDAAGEVVGAVNMLVDLTELNRTERALHESEVRLKAALVAAQMGTWVWHFAEDRLILDESLHDLMGFPPGKVGAGLAGFLAGVHSADRTAVRVAFERSASQGVELDVEFRVKSQDGTFRWVRDRGKVIPGTKSLPGYLTGACVDITEQRSAEESLREADRKKDEFLATLAHELRNPLAPLSNVLEILSRTGADISSFHEGREIMDRQVRKLTRLVDDLLDVARIRQGKIELRKELVDLSSLVPQALESVRHYIDAGGHTLTVSVPEEPVELHGDAVRLEQVIANLLHNAAKYTDPGGEITLSLVTVNPGTEFSTRDAVLSVRDTGVGIAPELLDRIFDFFVRADVSYSRNASGLGIGLSLVKSLVENHGGRVEAKSAGLGQGSEFVVRLPLRPGAKAKEAKATRKGQEPKPDVRRILVVDDNVDSAQSGARLLRLFGHEVQTAFNGPDALEAMSVFRPEVVLLDIGMPGMDGYEVARQIRSQAGFDAVALVALSGYGSEDDQARARKAGFDRHLIKPVDYDALAKLLAALKAAAL
jgi:PAS domain S-box-containing protein